MSLSDRQHLIFDADDTLWENNRYFEQAFDDFVSFLNHEHLDAAAIREVLDTIQREHRDQHGYGSRVFARSLKETYIRVMAATSDLPVPPEVEHFGLRILEQAMEPIPGVTETLAALRPHHDLILLTKGNVEEQRAKIERSDIAYLFDEALVVAEKHPETYRNLVREHDLDPARTWMIGNSPRSDINPALQAHINAVFIPHPLTWKLEVEEISHIRHHHPGELIELETFPQLQDVFLPEPPADDRSHHLVHGRSTDYGERD